MRSSVKTRLLKSGFLKAPGGLIYAEYSQLPIKSTYAKSGLCRFFEGCFCRFFYGAFARVFRASATKGLDMLVKVLLAVVVGELFPRRDILFSEDEDATIFDFGLAVRRRAARMIYIPRDILTIRSIDRPF